MKKKLSLFCLLLVGALGLLTVACALVAPVATVTVILGLTAALGAGLLARRLDSPHGHVIAANIAEGTHHNHVTRNADAAIATRYFLVKEGTTAGTTIAAIAAASDKPLGVCTDEPAAAGDPVAVKLLSANDKTVRMVAKVAITVGADVYSYGNGKVTVTPTAAGTYWKVGVALTAVTTDGDVIIVEPCLPQKIIVIAAATVGAALVTTGVTQSTPYGFAGATQGDALTTRVNELRADVLALQAAMATANLIKLATT